MAHIRSQFSGLKYAGKADGDKRAYHVFEELNTYTAVVYLKKVNHPASAAAPAAPAPTPR